MILRLKAEIVCRGSSRKDEVAVRLQELEVAVARMLV